MREVFCKYMVAEKGIKLYSGLLTGHKARVYASKGRVDNISENIAGSNFSTTFTYDEKGRLKTRTHPSGITETNNYNSSGYLASISAGGSTRYTVIAMNVRQQITAAYFGVVTATYEYNQYGYPAATTYGPVQNYRYSFNTVTGNLNWRKDSLRSLTENFTCDNLDRLKTVTGPQNLTMDYAANGNILEKSDVGNVFGYEHPTKPYALTGVETSTGLIPDALQTFAAYTSFEQPSVITESPYQATFTYNSEGQRAKMEVKQSGNTILTRWYVGSRYMKETSGGVTKEYTWIGGDAYSAPVAAVKQGSTTKYYAVLRDYLGNITNVVEEGDILNPDKYSFDAWGRRRNPANWSYSLGSEPALFAGRGFTSHEWLPWFNLYNMNGRLYDPIVGRFLSADNYVQAPGFTQSFNRYSYCLNNPLKYYDPTGEKWKWKWLNPFYWFDELMQWINDETEPLRDKMVEAGIPDFGVGVSVNGDGNVNVSGSYRGQEVFNTGNVDKSNASQKVNKKLNEVRQTHGQEWIESGTSGSLINRIWNSNVVRQRTGDAIFVNTGLSLAFLGGGSDNAGIILPLRGPDAFSPHLINTASFRLGGQLGYDALTIGKAWYNGPVSGAEIERIRGYGNSFDLNIGLIYGIGPGANAFAGYNQEGKITWYGYSGSIGWGVGGSFGFDYTKTRRMVPIKY